MCISIEPASRIDATAGNRQQGFTLLEVIVAVAIASLALIGLFQAGSLGLFATSEAGRVAEAVQRAESHLAAFSRVGTITPSNQEGDDGGGYRWRLRAIPLETQPAPPDEDITSSSTLFAVEVTISWRYWGRERSVVLDTRLFGPPAGFP